MVSGLQAGTKVAQFRSQLLPVNFVHFYDAIELASKGFKRADPLRGCNKGPLLKVLLKRFRNASGFSEHLDPKNNFRVLLRILLSS